MKINEESEINSDLVEAGYYFLNTLFNDGLSTHNRNTKLTFCTSADCYSCPRITNPVNNAENDFPMYVLGDSARRPRSSCEETT